MSIEAITPWIKFFGYGMGLMGFVIDSWRLSVFGLALVLIV